jgi:REP element-mobilizing transposase RayT
VHKKQVKIRKNEEIQKEGNKMGRKKREWYAGCRMHLMGRGIHRNAIYREEDDYKVFMQIIKRTQEDMPFLLHCYCLMTNHFHMLITTKETEIWHIMKRIMGNYAKYFNQKYGFKGHLFDSRYVSCITEDPRYFLEVSRYIHLNPVRAKMVREPLDYEYSSYASYVSGKIDHLNKEKVLGYFNGNQEEEYRMFVEGAMSHAEQEALIQKDIGEDELWLPW